MPLWKVIWFVADAQKESVEFFVLRVIKDFMVQGGDFMKVKMLYHMEA